MSHSDSGFIKVSFYIAGFLFLFTLIVFYAANSLSPSHGDADYVMQRVQQETMPAGSVNTDPTLASMTATATAAEQPTRSGKEVVDMACAACHASGVADAPLLDDAAEWQKRKDAAGGLDGLIANAVNGKGAMPPRGSSDASDEELAAAVRHLLGEE